MVAIEASETLLQDLPIARLTEGLVLELLRELMRGWAVLSRKKTLRLLRQVTEAVVEAQRRVLEFPYFVARELLVTSFWVPEALNTFKHDPKRPKHSKNYETL